MSSEALEGNDLERERREREREERNRETSDVFLCYYKTSDLKFLIDTSI
jgi:hypothetical protein